MVNWESPPEGWFKLNVDVDVDATRGLFGFGAVVCNHEGKKVMVSGVHKCGYVDDVDFCEVEVFRFGLWFISEIGLFPLLVESDSLRVVKLVPGQTYTCT